MLPSVWNPWRDLSRMDRDFGRLFGAFAEDANEAVAEWFPSVEIHEIEGDGYEIVAAVPGLKPEEIDVEVENNVLTLSGERKVEEKKEEGKRVIRRETFYGKFRRSFRLPDTVDGSKVTADYTNGELRVRVPHAEQAKPRKISVKAA